MYQFQLPIGDWSDDGHGKQEVYLIESSRPLNELRELYFQACDKLGYSLDGSYKSTDLTPNAEYEQYEFTVEQYESLRDFGVEMPESLTAAYNEVKENDDEDDQMYIDTEDWADLVLAFIRTQDPELVLTRIPEEEVPQFQFYGFDDQKRHIGYFGYGLFN